MAILINDLANLENLNYPQKNNKNVLSASYMFQSILNVFKKLLRNLGLGWPPTHPIGTNSLIWPFFYFLKASLNLWADSVLVCKYMFVWWMSNFVNKLVLLSLSAYKITYFYKYHKWDYLSLSVFTFIFVAQYWKIHFDWQITNTSGSLWRKYHHIFGTSFSIFYDLYMNLSWQILNHPPALPNIIIEQHFMILFL